MVRADAPPVPEMGGGSDERVVVDYARGGGSSGARLNDVGASGEDEGSAAGANACGAIVPGTTRIAAGAHGAIA